MRTLALCGALLLAGCGGSTSGSGLDAGAQAGTGGNPAGGGAGGSGGTPAGGGSAGCVIQSQTEYFFALATSLEKSKPIVARASVQAMKSGGTIQSTWILQMLSWADRKTIVGNPIVLGPISHPGTSAFDADPQPLDIVGEANPFSHTPITVDLASFQGDLCPGEEFACGTSGGLVTKPIELAIDGSSWTLTRVTGPADYPEPPPVDCQHTLAAPVGTWN